MAQPTPPPYVDVTGIARTDMKINKQETIAEYDGNARPGELVVDLTTYNLYIGNADGNLNGFTGGGGTNYANANLVAYLNTGLAGNIIPSANNVYSLGSPTRQWASIYVSANTLYLGATAVSSDGTGLLIGGEAVVTANTPITGNVEADYFIGDGSLLTNLPTGNYSNSNVANYLPTYSGNVTTITATGTIYAVGNVAGNVFIGNGSQLTGIVTNYSNANVANYLPTYSGNITAGNVSITGTVDIVGNITSGNILPAANNVYSLGSPTMLWSNLYVSSNTIYFGTVPVSVSETGMEIGNSAVVTAGTTTSGNVSADNFIGNLVLNSNIAITSTGTDSININSNDNIFLRGVGPLIGTATEGGDINIYGGDGSDADITGNSASGGGITIYGGDGGVGNLSFEGGDGGTIRIEGGIGANAYQDVGNSVYTSAKTGGDVLITGGNAGNNAGNTALGANGGSIFLYAGDATAEYTYGGIFLRGSQVQVQTESAIWNYNYEGNLTLPSTTMANIKGNTVNFITTTALNLQSNATINVQSNVSNITLSVLNANAVAQNFTYDNTGNLTIPNSINAASNTDPLIAGFSFEGGYVSVTGLVAGGYVRTLPTDVANLIPAGTANIAEQGTRAFVTDADSRTWGNLVTGGGANAVPIWTDGTDWYIG